METNALLLCTNMPGANRSNKRDNARDFLKKAEKTKPVSLYNWDLWVRWWFSFGKLPKFETNGCNVYKDFTNCAYFSLVCSHSTLDVLIFC